MLQKNMNGAKGENQKQLNYEKERPKRPKVNGPKNSLLTAKKTINGSTKGSK